MRSDSFLKTVLCFVKWEKGFVKKKTCLYFSRKRIEQSCFWISNSGMVSALYNFKWYPPPKVSVCLFDRLTASKTAFLASELKGCIQQVLLLSKTKNVTSTSSRDIGQVCRGEKVSRFWISFSFSFHSSRYCFFYKFSCVQTSTTPWMPLGRDCEIVCCYPHLLCPFECGHSEQITLCL